MITRYSSAVIAGSATTLFLFFVMQSLITLQPGAASELRTKDVLKFVRVPKVEDIRMEDANPIDERIKDFPQEPPRTITESRPTGRINVPAVDPRTPGDTVDRLSFRPGDGPLVSIVRVQPVYPARAIQGELEGWVIVEFDVHADGTVRNAFVVRSSNRTFERSAIDAVLKFRFKPRVVDGVPQVTTGLQNIFRFELEQN